MDLNSRYNLQKEDEKNLWKECLFVFDTSSLLNLYEYSQHTREQILNKLFNNLKGRLWITGWIKREFIRNRQGTLKKPIQHYQELQNTHLKTIENHLSQIISKTKTDTKHPHLSGDSMANFEASFRKFRDDLEKEIQKRLEEIEGLSNNDLVLETLKEKFQCGDQYDFNRLYKIAKKGEERYRLEIPPGFLDQKDKSGMSVFGDLIIWFQIIDISRKTKKPIILITDDLKEDWWLLKSKGKIDRPREELIDEMDCLAGNRFWMYHSAQFLEISNSLIKDQINEEAIQEVKVKSHTVYGFTAEHAVFNWARSNFKDDYVLTPNQYDSFIDVFIMTKNGDTHALIVKYLGNKLNDKLQSSIAALMEQVSFQIVDGFFDRVSLVLPSSEIVSAQKVKELVENHQAFSSTFRNTHFDVICGYLDGFLFVPLD